MRSSLVARRCYCDSTVKTRLNCSTAITLILFRDLTDFQVAPPENRSGETVFVRQLEVSKIDLFVLGRRINSINQKPGLSDNLSASNLNINRPRNLESTRAGLFSPLPHLFMAIFHANLRRYRRENHFGGCLGRARCRAGGNLRKNEAVRAVERSECTRAAVPCVRLAVEHRLVFSTGARWCEDVNDWTRIDMHGKNVAFIIFYLYFKVSIF